LEGDEFVDEGVFEGGGEGVELLGIVVGDGGRLTCSRKTVPA
jgi:hypothetical protein